MCCITLETYLLNQCAQMMYYLYDVMDANQTEEEQEDLAASYQEAFLIKARERKAVRSLWTLDNLLDNLKGRTGGESGRNIAAEVKVSLGTHIHTVGPLYSTTLGSAPIH